jgi:hypothetical protein
MFLSYPLTRQFAGKVAHFKRQQEALFSGHFPMNVKLESLRGRTCVTHSHRQMLAPHTLAPGDCADHNERLLAGCDLIGQLHVGRIVREVLLASKKSQEGPALQRIVIANGAAQHGITCLEGVEHRALSNRAVDFERHLAADMRQISQMEWKHDADHISVSAWTEISSAQIYDALPVKSTQIPAEISSQFIGLGGNV